MFKLGGVYKEMKGTEVLILLEKRPRPSLQQDICLCSVFLKENHTYSAFSVPFAREVFYIQETCFSMTKSSRFCIHFFIKSHFSA